MGKRLFLSLIVFLIAMTTASATGNTVTIDGIKYFYEYTMTLDGTGGGHITARVLVQDGKSKEGVVEIPASIIVDDSVKLFVTCIDDYAFDGNKEITKVIIPGCVWTIDGGAFRDCSALEEVVIQSETNFDNVFLGQNFDFKGLKDINADAFKNCTSLSKINFPETLHSIGNAAFYGCTSLPSVNLPDNCTSFGISYIFDGCTSLRSVSLPGGINIPTNAFSGCVNLESVTLRGAVNEIGDHAFKGCTSLKSINLSKGVKKIGEQAFHSSGLESITFPESGLEKIGGSCFAGSKLKSINIPDGVTFIGNYICNGCKELTDVVIQGGTYASTEQSQFKDCTNLSRVSLTWSGPLQSYMFLNCSSLTSIELRGNITQISSGTFLNCASLESITLPNTVSSIKGEAFKGCSNLESINIPSSVTEIGNEAFYECFQLSSEITIPAAVTELPRSVFNRCNSLKTVNLPSTMTKIGNGCFARCSQLEQLSIPSSLVTLEGYAFNSCSNLKTLVFPATMKSIGESAFANCASMELIDLRACTQLNITSTERKGCFKDLPESTVILLPGYVEPDPEDDAIQFVDAEVKSICVANWDTSRDGELSYKEAKAVTDLDRKFANQTTITSFDELQYFTGLKALNYNNGGQFELCEKLETITLPEGLKTIEGATFNYCRALKGIKIPASVTEMSYLGGWYFEMENITVDAGNTKYDSRDNCNAVIETATNTLISGCNKTVIPNTVTTIGPFAFNACVTDSIAIPNSVTTIGKSAFSTCRFTGVGLPASITSIDEAAFNGCTAIKHVTSDIAEPFAINDNTFDNSVYDTAILWVPTKEAVEKYMAADGWKNFKNIKYVGTITTGDDSDHQDYFRADYTPIDGGAEVSKVDSSEGDVEIPTTITIKGQNVAVTSIAGKAFAGNTNLTSVTVPSNVKNIGDGAFSGCTSLEYLDLSDANITNLSTNAISGLSEETVVVLPEAMSATNAQALSAASTNVVYKDGNDYKSANVKLTDGKKFNAPASVSSITAAEVTYPRSFSISDVVYSICLPYRQPIPTGMKAYELDNFNGVNLVFKEVENSMEALKPYLLTSSSSVSSLNASNVTMSISGSSTDMVVTGYDFCGSLKPIPNVDASGCLILQGDKLWHPVGTKDIPANRAYLKQKANAARITGTVFVDSDGTTSIKTIDRDGTENYYDLQGHRISKPVKAGIYVKDGRKTVVK